MLAPGPRKRHIRYTGPYPALSCPTIMNFVPHNALEEQLAAVHAGTLDPETFVLGLIDQQLFMPVRDEKDAIQGFQRSAQAEPLIIEDEDGEREVEVERGERHHRRVDAPRRRAHPPALLDAHAQHAADADAKIKELNTRLAKKISSRMAMISTRSRRALNRVSRFLSRSCVIGRAPGA